MTLIALNCQIKKKKGKESQHLFNKCAVFTAQAGAREGELRSLWGGKSKM